MMVQRGPDSQSLRHWCLFVDVDGTLIEHADAPDSVSVPQDLPMRLGLLADALGGALALISGRTLESLDRLFAPLRLPAAGVHGLQRRDGQGRNHDMPCGTGLEAARADLAGFAQRHPGVLLESKPGALALHYRRAPQIEGEARDCLGRVAARLGPSFTLLSGDMVFEIKPRFPDKGSAVEAFLAEAPFAGRVPIFIGNDQTDRDAMRVVKHFQGVTIAVGDRVAADRRFPDPGAVRRWLGGFLHDGDPLR